MNHLPLWSHGIDLSPEPGSILLAREFVGRRLAEHGLSHLVDDIRLVASELATNAIVHANSGITVLLQLNGSVVTLSVHDSSSAVPVMTVGDVMDACGRGLVIIDLLSLEWGVAALTSGDVRAVHPGPAFGPALDPGPSADLARVLPHEPEGVRRRSILRRVRRASAGRTRP
jgi:hypothetical protein